MYLNLVDLLLLTLCLRYCARDAAFGSDHSNSATKLRTIILVRQGTPAPQNTEGSLLGGDIMTAGVYPYQEKGLPIDVCASLLAQVDARGYQRAMIRDAHQISRHILEPMCKYNQVSNIV